MLISSPPFFTSYRIVVEEPLRYGEVFHVMLWHEDDSFLTAALYFWEKNGIMVENEGE